MTSIKGRLKILFVLIAALFIYSVSSLPTTTLSSVQTLDNQNSKEQYLEEKVLKEARKITKEAEKLRDISEHAKKEKHSKAKQHVKNGIDSIDKEPTSTTIVTTVVVISTETPTTIYSDTNANPSKQQASQQVSDPNSTDISQFSNIPQEIAVGMSAYHQLMIILTVVGSLAAIALITGIVVITRMRLKKKKQKQHEQHNEENPDDDDSPPMNQHYITPPPSARLSSLVKSAVKTNDNPFDDPSNLDVHITPSAPPHSELSNDIDPEPYCEENRRLSQATAIASAPTAKELDVIHRFNQPSVMVSSSLQSSRTVQRQQSTNSTDFLPPPAYTPQIAPSAPPFYVLPQQNQQSNTSRRYSIDNSSLTRTSSSLRSSTL